LGHEWNTDDSYLVDDAENQLATQSRRYHWPNQDISGTEDVDSSVSSKSSEDSEDSDSGDNSASDSVENFEGEDNDDSIYGAYVYTSTARTITTHPKTAMHVPVQEIIELN